MNQQTNRQIQALLHAEHQFRRDPDFERFVAQLPDEVWTKYDPVAVRFGWEAAKALAGAKVVNRWGERVPVTRKRRVDKDNAAREGGGR